ncbi:MAG TPA: MBL fold metallo-hydrolase [Kofleriaceae bacterium]|nr:MBL fold metallo-hydrolase [Kofleriaceae bacterium]
MRPEAIAFAADALRKGEAAGSASAVTVRWLGTAGFAIEHDGHTLLIDPYVTRASLGRCAVAALRPDLDAIARYVPRADAIIVGHSHFDHALDVPDIARATGARVFGSQSAVALCRISGLPESQVDLVERPAGSAPVEREVGPFHLRFVPSAHSRFLAGRVPFPGDIADCDDVPLRTERYRCGAVFGIDIEVAGRRLYHVGSAELVEAALTARPRNVDLLLLCVAGWTSTRDFPERVVRAFSPAAALLHHWDNFFRPLTRPATALPAMRMPQLVERLGRAAPEIRTGTLALLGELHL